MENFLQKNLILSSRKNSWQLSDEHGALVKKNKKVLGIYEKILKRDNCTCYYCGFKSTKYQEIHHLNDNHNDFSEDNLVAICPLCHQVFHLNIVNNTTGGKIIWLPEFSQQELNYLLRALFICMAEDENPINSTNNENNSNVKFYNMAKSIYQSLESREQIVAQHFYSGTGNDTNENNVGAFGQMLLNMTEEEYNDRIETISNFKLLATPGKFDKQIKYWKSKTYANLPLNTWEKLVIEQQDDNEE